VGVTPVATGWSQRFDEFHERAAAGKGWGDFGDSSYYEGLRTLLGALDDRPPMPGRMSAAAEDLILGSLGSRLHTQAQWRANPAYLERQLSRPLIVMGMPRTGTTALHNLLSQDPQFQGIEKWLTAAPRVRLPRAEWDADPQYCAAVAMVDHMSAIAPEVMKAHGVVADQVDECLLPMAQSFCSNFFPSQLDIPLYDAWFLGADERLAFERYRDVLRLVGLNDDRRWLLKNPSHVFGIDALLETFPDAVVVQTHRDPVASLASLVNLLANIMIAYAGEDIDRERRLQREIAFYGEAMRRSMAAQDRDPGRFVNVMQSDIRRDPLGVVDTIYSKVGLLLSPEAEQAMRNWAERNAEQTQASHEYARIDDQGAIRNAFAAYIERYGL
jgi:hypothetical protein